MPKTPGKTLLKRISATKPVRPPDMPDDCFKELCNLIKRTYDMCAAFLKVKCAPAPAEPLEKIPTAPISVESTMSKPSTEETSKHPTPQQMGHVTRQQNSSHSTVHA